MNDIVNNDMLKNLEAEKYVLGAILYDDKQALLISDFLKPDDFYDPVNKIIYSMILNLKGKNQRIDTISLKAELENKSYLEKVGGIRYILSLLENIFDTGLIEQHASLIREKAIIRELVTTSTDILSKCHKPEGKNYLEILDEAETSIFNIAGKGGQQGFSQISIWLTKTFKHLSEIRENPQGLTGISSGYKKLDKLTCGFQKGDLIVLAARPAMGKTALALSLGVNAAKENYTVGFFSLEMSAEQLILRMLSLESGVPHQTIRNSNLNADEWLKITETAGMLAGLKLFIDESPMLSILELKSKARKLKASHNLNLLIVDYLQLITTNRRHENRHQEVSEVSRSLKALAKELDIPIIALAQLSRNVESREEKRPLLSDLRESGAIEQDSDLIMFLYRDIMYNRETENPALSEIIIGKQRNGPTDTVYLNFLKTLTKFVEVEYE